VLKDIIEKTLKSEEQRDLVKYAIAEHEMSERQAYRTISMNRGTYRYQASKTDDHEIVQELQQLSESQPRWDCRKMTGYLRNQGHHWNHKRIRRIYRGLALDLHRKPKKRLGASAVQLDLASGSKSIIHYQQNEWCECWKICCCGELLPNKSAWIMIRGLSPSAWRIGQKKNN
jgi:hypothetical protein